KVDDFPSSGDHPGRLFVVARGIRRDAARLRGKQVSLFLGRTTLISFEDEGCDLFEAVRRRLQKPASRVCRNDASFLLYSLLDVLIDDLFPVLEDLGHQVDQLERSVLAQPTL